MKIKLISNILGFKNFVKDRYTFLRIKSNTFNNEFFDLYYFCLRLPNLAYEE